MAYTSLTDSTHSKWWIKGTGSVVNRLSEVMDDQADGPYYTTAAGSWTASTGDAAEYYHAPTKRPDNVYCAGVKLTEKSDNTFFAVNYYAASVNVTTGSVGAGSVSDTQADDATKLRIDEAAGTPALDFDFTFNSLPATDYVDKVHINGYYDGNPAHDVFVYMWNYNTSAWVRLTSAAQDFPDAAADADYTFDVPSTNRSYYFSGGTAKVRINHTSAGSSGHYFYVDLIRMYMSVGTGLANGEWCWDTNNSRVYVQIAAGDPDGVTTSLYYDWNGSVSGTNFMTEVLEDCIYRIHNHMEIGDGSTTTVLDSQCEHIHADDNISMLETQAAATLNVGIAEATYSRYGSSLYFCGKTGVNNDIADGGNVNIYGSTLYHKTSAVLATWELRFSGAGTVNIYNTNIISTNPTYNNFKNRFWLGGSGTITLYNVFITGFAGFYLTASAPAMTNVWVHDSFTALVTGANSVTFTGLKVTDSSLTLKIHNSYVSAGKTLTVIDNDFGMASYTASNVQNGHADSIIYEKYTINIHVADKTGADLSGATVTWLDSQSNTGNTTTDVNGDLTAPFTLTARQFAGTSETLTDFNTFTFTISKAGYETLSIENVTIDAPIDWHIELKGKVKHTIGGTTYFGDDS